jgi:hypothetical protein
MTRTVVIKTLFHLLRAPELRTDLFSDDGNSKANRTAEEKAENQNFRLIRFFRPCGEVRRV